MRALGTRAGTGTSTGSFPLQKTLYGANVIIFEGIMAFADKTLLEVRAGSRPSSCRDALPQDSPSMPPLGRPCHPVPWHRVTCSIHYVVPGCRVRSGPSPKRGSRTWV